MQKRKQLVERVVSNYKSSKYRQDWKPVYKNPRYLINSEVVVYDTVKRAIRSQKEWHPNFH